jgi:NTE family protein
VARLIIAVVALLLAGCATRPVNPPLSQYEPGAGYRWADRPELPRNDPQTLLILAFSGGGTRAAAFSYGVLEELRRTAIGSPESKHTMLAEVDLISGVSGGSFTALAYALKGEALFPDYEQEFLNRNVEGELLKRLFDPVTWPSTLSAGFGRSELAEQYYDDILFHGATFADLVSRPTATALVSATDIATGLRWTFSQTNFDVICSDLGKMRLARAAAASSAVPVVLSPVTIDNYGGSCGYADPAWVTNSIKPRARAWEGNRALQRYRELQGYQQAAERPYIHLVDGGLSGNLGVNGIVDVLQELEASPRFRAAVGVERLRRIAIVIVNAVTAPDLGYSKREAAPSSLQLLLQALSVPIDRYSYESVDALEDLVDEWRQRRKLEVDSMRLKGQPIPASAITPLDFSVINVSFDDLADPAERQYLLNLPTSFALPAEAIARLRAAASKLLRDSPAYRKLIDSVSNPK